MERLGNIFHSRNAIVHTDRDSIGTPNTAYRRMERTWDLPRDLLGGTIRMRDAETKWLPQEPAETVPAYENRLHRSVLYNMYGDTVDKVSAKPFSKPVVIEPEQTDERIDAIIDDADRTGTSLTQFGKQLFYDMIVYGKCHVLVDFPSLSESLNKKQEKDAGVRPYFVRISPLDLIGWKTERDEQGAERASEIRIRETRIEPDGKFGDEEVEYVRWIGKNEWELHRHDKKANEFTQLQDTDGGSGANSLGKVPIVTAYAKQVGFFESEPPFEDLAWLNLIHYQSDSDHRNILRFIRFGLLFLKGISDEEYEEGIEIGPAKLIRTTEADADMKYVEHAGNAVGAGTADLDKIEQRAEILGLQPLIARTGTETATGRVMDKVETSSEVQTWIGAEEDAIRDAFRLADEWIKADVDKERKVNIFSDFAITVKSNEDMKLLLELWKARVLPSQELLEAAKRRGILDESLNVKETVDAAIAEQAARQEAAQDSFIEGDFGDDDDDDDEKQPAQKNGEQFGGNRF